MLSSQAHDSCGVCYRGVGRHNMTFWRKTCAIDPLECYFKLCLGTEDTTFEQDSESGSGIHTHYFQNLVEKPFICFLEEK